MVVEDGETTLVEPEVFPVHVYELAPDAVRVVLAPAQMVLEVDVTEMVGTVITETVIEAILLVHVPLDPLTV